MKSIAKWSYQKISLPTFCIGKNESFRKFIIGFESITNKHRLKSFEKGLYLKEQLSMSPRTLLGSFNTEQEPYENAKDLLKQAFDHRPLHDVAKPSLHVNRPLVQGRVWTCL